jgi:hypothetical protein
VVALSLTNIEADPWAHLWRANTSRQSYDKSNGNDITVEYYIPSKATYSVNRDLGVNNVNNSWKISGEILYPAGNNANGSVLQQYLEVVDANDKVLTTFYLSGSGGATTLYGNNAAITSSVGYTIKGMEVLSPFEVSVDNGNVTFTYGNYKPVTTTISDATGNWKTPKTLRIRVTNTGAAGSGYGGNIGIKDFKFYVDNSTTAPPDNLQPAVNPSNPVNGLDYKYYEGNWTALPNYPALSPIKTGTTSNFDLSLANRSDQYGFSFTGFINVPADGQYTFYTSSDDGSSLYIDNLLTVSNDGLHGAVEKSGTIALKAGMHAINGLFFQQGGGQVFLVSYEGMGIAKQTIPSSALFRSSSANIAPVADAGADKRLLFQRVQLH